MWSVQKCGLSGEVTGDCRFGKVGRDRPLTVGVERNRRIYEIF